MATVTNRCREIVVAAEVERPYASAASTQRAITSGRLSIIDIIELAAILEPRSTFRDDRAAKPLGDRLRLRHLPGFPPGPKRSWQKRELHYQKQLRGG